MKAERRPLILNVDDDEAGRYAVTRQLQLASYDVIEAAGGREALEKVATMHPDLVLLDVHLPDMSGFEVCRHLRQNPETARTSILHLSATYSDSGSRVTGLEGGADGYLTAPLDPPVLVATIKALLRLKQAEQTVRESAARWQATFDAITDCVAVLDDSGRVVRLNRAFEDFLGKPAGEIKGALWNELVPEPTGWPRLFQQMLASRRRESSEQTFGGKALMISIDPIFESDETLEGGVCIVCDVTDRRRIERELEHAQKLESIGVLAGGVAHDFNNLLTGVLGNASLLADNLTPDSPDMQLVDEIVRASQSAAHLTQQLLAYAGKGLFFIRAVDLSKVIWDGRPLVQAFVPKNIDLRLELAESTPQIMADPGQIQQMVMNLVINSAEAISGAPGVITIRTECQAVTHSRACA